MAPVSGDEIVHFSLNNTVMKSLSIYPSQWNKHTSSARGSRDHTAYQGSSRDDKVYTGEWRWYQGAWYQKVIRYGRTEWEPQ